MSARRSFRTARRSFRTRLRYKFDTLLARGTVMVILWLGLITAAVVLVTGTLLSVLDIAVHGHQVGVIEGVWQNMLRSFEPAAMEADTGWPLRLQSLFVVLFGIFVVSSLIGLIASGIERRVEELRKGRSEVIEQGHVLILNWSEKIFPVIAELVLAHKGQKDSVIVVLADHDKIEMEDAIRARVRHMGGTRVVCRRGDPSNPADLALVSPYQSRSVIVLGNNHMDGDAQVIRSVLALMDDEERFPSLRVVPTAPCPRTPTPSARRPPARPSPSPRRTSLPGSRPGPWRRPGSCWSDGTPWPPRSSRSSAAGCPRGRPSESSSTARWSVSPRSWSRAWSGSTFP